MQRPTAVAIAEPSCEGSWDDGAAGCELTCDKDRGEPGDDDAVEGVGAAQSTHRAARHPTLLGPSSGANHTCRSNRLTPAEFALEGCRGAVIQPLREPPC